MRGAFTLHKLELTRRFAFFFLFTRDGYQCENETRTGSRCTVLLSLAILILICMLLIMQTWQSRKSQESFVSVTVVEILPPAREWVVPSFQFPNGISALRKSQTLYSLAGGGLPIQRPNERPVGCLTAASVVGWAFETSVALPSKAAC